MVMDNRKERDEALFMAGLIIGVVVTAGVVIIALIANQ